MATLAKIPHSKMIFQPIIHVEEPAVFTVITFQRSVTHFFSMTASAPVHTVQQASCSSAYNYLDPVRTGGHVLSTSSHNLTACRARKHITRICTSKLIWIPELHGH